MGGIFMTYSNKNIIFPEAKNGFLILIQMA